jgi:hypothetical protein
MKKPLLTFLTLFLMFSGVASAEKVNFVCKNINDREIDFALIIDLKGKTITRDGTKYIINSMNKTKIFASKKYKLENITGEIVLTFDRVIGKLLYRDFRDGLRFDFADFACKKLD